MPPFASHPYRIPFNRPTVVSGQAASVSEALAGGTLAGNGPFTKRCEARLQELTGARRALLTNSCTGALDISALVLDARPGDEVIVPSFTFVSTANAFASRGFRPVFADCRPDTLNIDERLIEGLITPRTRAIVVMHYGGVACEMDAVLEIAARHGLPVVEDNAHGLFGRYKARPLGTFGAAATQSFHETKNVTCGEGGALLVNDEGLIGRAEVAREKGTDRSRFFRGEIDRYTWIGTGANYLASELQAALLWSQLECWRDIQRRRQAIWSRYDTSLRGWTERQGVTTPAVPPYCEHPAHLYAVMLPSASARSRLIQHLKNDGILAVFHYLPLHRSPMGVRFGGGDAHCPVAEDVSERLLRLPFYTNMTVHEQEDVIAALLAFEV
jgi:dTDP-4-amino-4,6-dideoxygalactose transaminase